MKYRIIGKYGHNMWSEEMMETLGLKAGGHLPDEGLPEREIQGIRVYVKPLRTCCEYHRQGGQGITCTHNSDGKRGSIKSSRHRVIAICPGCQRHLSAGRLHQHICKKGAGK